MKKLFALFLACMMLFLTACNQTPPNETTSDNSQKQENSNLKDTIIKNGSSKFIDMPSRVIFEQNGKVFYYSKADDKAYVYCFDPLCDHAGGKCLANPEDETEAAFSLKSTFFIQNRFYAVTGQGIIFSFAFDGSDRKIEYDAGYSLDAFNVTPWSPNFRVYDQYIYIHSRAHESGEPHSLRFNVETKEMEDLTEKTGNYMAPVFFYNGEIYGRDYRGIDWFKSDLEMKNMESIEALPTSTNFYGSLVCQSKFDYTNSNSGEYLGLELYDMKTGESKLLTNEILGLNEYSSDPFYSMVLYMNENYIYFTQYRENRLLIGTAPSPTGKINKIYTYDTGKLYRMKHDGTECTLIYDNPNFEFDSREAVICGDKILIEGSEYAIGADGYVVWTSSGMQVGTIGEDGKIEKFEPIELVY